MLKRSGGRSSLLAGSVRSRLRPAIFGIGSGDGSILWTRDDGEPGDRTPDPRLGPRRGLLPDLPRPVRPEPDGAQAPAPGRVGRAADLSRLPGRRPDRRRRAPGLPGRPRRQRHVFHADLPVGVEPSLSHARLREGRPDAGGQPRAAADDRRGARAGIRVVLDGVFNHASRGFFQFHDILENGPNSAYLDWFTVNEFPLYRLRRREVAQLQGLVGPARPAEVQHRLARGARVPLGHRPQVDRVRHRRLAAGRPQRDRRRRLLARVPPPRPRRQPRGVHRRRGLGRRPAMAPGRHVGRRDELPVHPGLHRLLHRGERQPRGPLEDEPASGGTRPAPRRSAARSSG